MHHLSCVAAHLPLSPPWPQVTFDLKSQLAALAAAARLRPAGLALPQLADVADPVVDVRIMLWMLNPDSENVRIP